MVFQDFDLLQERRRAERQRKFRKRVTIAAITAFVLLILVAAGVFAVITTSKKNAQTPTTKSKPAQASSSTNEVSRADKLIKTICNATTYKDSCQSTLQKAVKSNPASGSQPKDLLKSAISATADELDQAFEKASTFTFDTPQEKQALNVCREVIANAKEELQASIDKVGDDLGKLVSDGEINSWLSAVMSYQETCIDSFPEGRLKSNIKSSLNASQELTSNSLAMVKQLSSYVSSVMQIPGASRHLLQSTASSLDKDGLPNWINHEERRILKGADLEKPTPNVTVAKDGSGNFTTISAALAAIPKKYDGRYVIYIKAGIYDETVNVTKKMVNVTMYGDGSQKTIITGSKNYVDGVPTYLTASFGMLITIYSAFLKKSC